MKSAYDEIYATALERQHEPQRLVGDLLKAGPSREEAAALPTSISIAVRPA